MRSTVGDSIMDIFLESVGSLADLEPPCKGEIVIRDDLIYREALEVMDDSSK